MNLKYVMFEVRTPRGPNLAIPFLFFEPITHVEFVEDLEHGDALPVGSKLRSAGFVRLTAAGLTVHGVSESLKAVGKPHAPQPDDDGIIFNYNYAHGILP